ncbi:MAG: hypothetical protein ACC726_11720 [Chloroflexota bacterium]
MNKRFTSGVALAAVLTIIGSGAVLAHEGDENPLALTPLSASDFGVLPNTATVDGQPITSWIEKYDDWFQQTPGGEHYFSTGECQGGQGGPVFFLGNVSFGTTQVFDCTIEPGQNILLSPGFGFGFDDETGDSLEVVYDTGLDNAMMLFNPKLIIDGRPVPFGGSTWFDRGAYTMDLVEGNLFGAPAGAYNAASNGWYMMLEPLESGKHTIIMSDEILRPVISTDDVDGDTRVVVEDPHGVGETITATAVFNITVPDLEAAAE